MQKTRVLNAIPQQLNDAISSSFKASLLDALAALAVLMRSKESFAKIDKHKDNAYLLSWRWSFSGCLIN